MSTTTSISLNNPLVQGGLAVAAVLAVTVLVVMLMCRSADNSEHERQEDEHASAPADMLQQRPRTFESERPQSFAQLMQGALVPEFVDVQGNTSFSAVTYQDQVPTEWLMPSKHTLKGLGGESSRSSALYGGMPSDTALDGYKLSCTSNADCGSQGSCDFATGRCKCNATASGTHCQMPAGVNTTWSVPVMGV